MQKYIYIRVLYTYKIPLIYMYAIHTYTYYMYKRIRPHISVYSSVQAWVCHSQKIYYMCVLYRYFLFIVARVYVVMVCQIHFHVLDIYPSPRHTTVFLSRLRKLYICILFFVFCLFKSFGFGIVCERETRKLKKRRRRTDIYNIYKDKGQISNKTQ